MVLSITKPKGASGEVFDILENLSLQELIKVGKVQEYLSMFQLAFASPWYHRNPFTVIFLSG